MTVDEFVLSLSDETQAPKDPYLLSLWLDGRDDWEGAHTTVQDLTSKEAAHIHAYLHRKEGDSGNAAYWYRQAGTDYPTNTLADEWRALVAEHL